MALEDDFGGMSVLVRAWTWDRRVVNVVHVG